ncbi:MAG: amino acid ABC transporter permease [Deltaproteobacteria bacterium]|nr:amino acid ABC transporter permease [Deltaproteobacteria bacterium]
MTFRLILGELAKGTGYTILVTLVCIATGLGVGLSVAMLGRLRFRPLQFLLGTFTYLFRGIPVLVLLFIVFFGLPGIGLRISPLLAMVLSLGLISGAYLAEIFRGALNAVDGEELLAAEAMGMTLLQSFRYIALPQMLRFSVPGMINEFTSVLKYSPFAYTVGIPEIMQEAMNLAALTLRGLEIYLAIGIIYFVIYKIFLALFTVLEKRTRIPGLSMSTPLR